MAISMAVRGRRLSASQYGCEAHDGGTSGYNRAGGLSWTGRVCYSYGGRCSVDGHGRSLGNLDAVCRADYLASRDGLGHDAGGGGTGGAARPGRPWGVGTPGPLSPARPVAFRASRSTPPVRPWAVGSPFRVGCPVTERSPAPRSPGTTAIRAAPWSTSGRTMFSKSSRLMGGNWPLARSVAGVIWWRCRYSLWDFAFAFERFEGFGPFFRTLIGREETLRGESAKDRVRVRCFPWVCDSRGSAGEGYD